jgi:hypothetical protein
LCEMVLAEAVVPPLINRRGSHAIPDMVRTSSRRGRYAGSPRGQMSAAQVSRRQIDENGKCTIHEGQWELHIVTDVHLRR